jgi:S1-C subfamily serine protease
MNLYRTLSSAVILSFALAACSTEQKKPVPSAERAEGPAYLGILYVETHDGVMVSDVYPGSPAEKAGLRPYDLILSANGFPVIGPYTFKERILALKPGTQVEIEVMNRDGVRSLKRATLEVMPERFRRQGEQF